MSAPTPGSTIPLEENFDNQTMDIGANNKDSQVSIIIKQEESRNGLMFFLRKVEQQTTEGGY